MDPRKHVQAIVMPKIPEEEFYKISFKVPSANASYDFAIGVSPLRVENSKIGDKND